MLLWVKICFTFTFSLAIIIPRSLKVFEGILDCGPVIRSTVGLEAADYAYSTIFFKTVAKLGIHKTSYG